MKQRIRFLALLLTAAMVFACWAVTAFAAQQPHIVLKASGVQGQFILRLDNFSSKFYAAEFAVYVDRPLDTSQIQVAWKDAVPADVNWPVIAQENGRTKLSFYISRNRPIANSNSVELAELTFPQELPASAFSAGSELKALEEGGASTIFQNPSLTVTGAPASSAAIRASGLTAPSGRGGVTMTISRTPAIRAGMAFIKMVEGNASGLRGTQMPTFSMGIHRWPMTTPGRSARRKPLCLCRSWNRRMFSAASRKDSRK